MPRDSSTISNNMRKIHSKDTSIELLLRKALWHKGYRYRKNYRALPGSPDIVLTKYKIAIFCDSEFFHGKDWEILKLRLEKGKNSDFLITISYTTEKPAEPKSCGHLMLKLCFHLSMSAYIFVFIRSAYRKRKRFRSRAFAL